jgi:hypothetical protein
VVVLAFALISHPLHLDLGVYGLVIPPHARTVALITFESLQFVVFAWATFFWDTLPGMRRIITYVRTLRAEMATAPLKTRLAKVAPLALALGSATWLILKTLEPVRDLFPPGPPRFYAATAFFIIERLVLVIGFLIAVESGDDDDPQERRRSIARAAASLFRHSRLQPAVAPLRSSRAAATRRSQLYAPGADRISCSA